MNLHTQKRTLRGGAGDIEALLDHAVAADGSVTGKGVAVIAHPHPLFGGSMHNKVVQTLARAFVAEGWAALRFNFRGVGASAGVHDEGRDESEDLRDVIEQARGMHLGPALALAGFSFGAAVTCRAAATLDPAQLAALVLVGTATSRFAVPPVAQELHLRTLVVHGEVDDTVPLASVLDWARPQHLPVTVVPGVEHFFHGQLTLLKNLVTRHLRA